MMEKLTKCRTQLMKMVTDQWVTISQLHRQVKPPRNSKFKWIKPNNFSVVPEAIARAVEYLKSLPPYVEPVRSNQKKQ